MKAAPDTPPAGRRHHGVDRRLAGALDALIRPPSERTMLTLDWNWTRCSFLLEAAQVAPRARADVARSLTRDQRPLVFAGIPGRISDDSDTGMPGADFLDDGS